MNIYIMNLSELHARRRELIAERKQANIVERHQIDLELDAISNQMDCIESEPYDRREYNAWETLRTESGLC